LTFCNKYDIIILVKEKETLKNQKGSYVMKYTIKNEYGEFTAVLYSPGFGGGYSTWGYDPMDGKVIGEILEELERSGEFNPNEVDDETEIEVSAFMPDFNDLLVITFIPVGKMFRINEYDGSESIEYYSPDDYYTA
jgi:hypothetical protein